MHYSAKPLGVLYSVLGQPDIRNAFQKPYGFWISVEGADDWKSWCESEGFGGDRLVMETEIELAEDASILWLRSREELIAFTKTYGVDIGMFYSCQAIDWHRVASEYQGIVIAPYQWSSRLDTFTSWYYGWDCASGCIWDVDAIRVRR